MAVRPWENSDPERAKIEYAAEVLAHEFALAVRTVAQDTGVFRPADMDGVERGLDAVADAINNLAEAIREGNARR